MSHTYRYDDGTVFIGSPDMDGDFIVGGRAYYRPDEHDEVAGLLIAGETLLEFVAAYVARQRMAAIEQATARDLLRCHVWSTPNDE